MLGYCGGGSFIHGVTERVLEIVLRRLGEGDTRLRRSNKSNEHIVVDRLDGWGLLRSITLSVGIIIGARSYGIISSNSTQFILKIAVDFASSTEAWTLDILKTGLLNGIIGDRQPFCKCSTDNVVKYSWKCVRRDWIRFGISSQTVYLIFYEQRLALAVSFHVLWWFDGLRSIIQTLVLFPDRMIHTNSCIWFVRRFKSTCVYTVPGMKTKSLRCGRPASSICRSDRNERFCWSTNVRSIHDFMAHYTR